MDTRDLSAGTYKAVINTAYDFHKDLAMQFGMLAKLSRDEADYIAKAGQLIELMDTYNADEVDAMFVEEPPSMGDFKSALKLLALNIAAL